MDSASGHIAHSVIASPCVSLFLRQESCPIFSSIYSMPTCAHCLHLSFSVSVAFQWFCSSPNYIPVLFCLQFIWPHAFSQWPTIPQVYVNGEFVGGCDILIKMHQVSLTLWVVLNICIFFHWLIGSDDMEDHILFQRETLNPSGCAVRTYLAYLRARFGA